MAKHVVVVLSEPFEGQDDAFNDWYENTHIDEVLTSAGVDSGQRFELRPNTVLLYLHLRFALSPSW